MEDQVKRLFIGGLPSSTTDSEIRTRFGKFCDISDINLAKKDSVNGALEHCFAHFNFHGNDQQVKKLVSTFNNTRWKGKTLKIETAKENFLDRLAKEKSEGPQDNLSSVPQTRGDQLLEHLKTAGVTNFILKKAVPGTGIAGEKNWIVGKYGRVMPVVYMRTRDRKKVVKFDPSKYIHNLKQIKDSTEHRKDGTRQAWREPNTQSHVRNRWVPQDRELGGVAHSSVERKGDVQYRGQLSDRAEGQDGRTFAVAAVEKDINKVGGSVRERRPSAKKYFSDGSSSDDSGTTGGKLKRKAQFDRDLTNATSKVKKTNRHQVSVIKSNTLSGSFNEEVKGQTATDGIGTEKENIKRNRAIFVKMKDGSGGANSYLFNFFDDHVSSSSEIEQDVGTYGCNTGRAVDMSELSSTEENSDLLVEQKKEEKTITDKNVEVKVKRKYDSTKSGNVIKSQSTKWTNVADTLNDEENLTVEGNGISSVTSQHGNSNLATSPEVAKVTVDATGESKQDSGRGILEGYYKSSFTRIEEPVSEVTDPEDLISSIIDEMKRSEPQGNEVDSGIIGNVIDESQRPMSGDIEKADSYVTSKSVTLQTLHLNKPGLSGSEYSKDINIADENGETLITGGDSDTTIQNRNKGKCQLERNSVKKIKGITLLEENFGGKQGLTSERDNMRDDGWNVSEIDAGRLFKSNLMSLSSQKKSDLDSDADESDEGEDFKDDETREDEVTKETGNDADEVSKHCGEEVEDSSGRLRDNMRNANIGKENEQKSLETSEDTEQNSGRDKIKTRTNGDVKKHGEISSLQGGDCFEPLVLDREVLRRQGLIPEAVENEEFGSSGNSDEDDSQSIVSSDEKVGTSRKRKKKFLFREFKGMNHFRRELHERESCDVEAEEPLTSKDGGDEMTDGTRDGAKKEAANSTDDDERPSKEREMSTLRISGSIEDVGSQSEDQLTLSEEKGGIEGKSDKVRKTKNVKKGKKVKNESKASPKTKPVTEAESVEVRAEEEDERKGLDADDESSSTESLINGVNEKKKKKKKRRSKKNGEDVMEENNLEKSLTSTFEVSEMSGVVEDGTPKNKTRIQSMDDDGEPCIRRKGSVRRMEEGKGSLLVVEREEILQSRSTKTLFSKDRRNFNDLQSTETSEDVPTKHAGANLPQMTRGERGVSEDVTETSNQKRLKAIKERQAELKQNQTAIKDALAEVDSKEKSTDKNHMRFDSSSDAEAGERDITEQKKPDGNLMTLFNDDDDVDNSTSDDDRFQLKPQFEGEQGTKLLKLQDRFGDDQRFKLDKRFAEDDDEDGKRNKGITDGIGGELKEGERIDPEAVDLEAEKLRSLAILENVLGILLPRKKGTDDKKSQFRDVNYLHFDPTREDHSKFILTQDEDSKPGKKKRRKRKKQQQGDEDDSDINPLPEVSKTLFSEVTTDLKSAFSQEGPASFSFFKDDDAIIDGKEKHINQDEEQAVPLTDPLFDKKKLPWDSSDSEEEMDTTVEDESSKTIKPQTIAEPEPNTCIAESFFFTRNDNRLQGAANQFCRGKDADKMEEVWNNVKQQVLQAGSKRHQKALRDGHRDTRRGGLSKFKNFKGKSPGGKS